MRPSDAPAVGMVTEKGLRMFEAKRRSEGKKAEQAGLALERLDIQLPEPPPKKAPEPAILEPGELRLPNDAPVRQQAPAPIVRRPPPAVPSTARPKPVAVPAKKHPATSAPPNH